MNSRYYHLWEKTLMLLAEGWKISLNGYGDIAYIHKGDEYYQWGSYDLFRVAAAVVKDHRNLARDLEQVRSMMFSQNLGLGI